MCDALTDAGVTPWLVDFALRPHGHDFATVGGGALAHASGIAWEALAKLSRADAAQIMIKGGGKIVSPKAMSGAIDGIIGVGGANGSTLSLIHISEPTRLGMISYAV